MGRLVDRRARRACTMALLVVGPLAALLDARLLLPSGAPAVAIVVGLAVAYLLSIGPRGAFAVAPVLLVDALVGGAAPVAAVAVAVLRTGACVVVVAALEARFRHHGRVRTPWVMIDFAVLGAALLPVVATAAVDVVSAIGLDVGGRGPFAQRALADGLGVLAVTAGGRMLLMGERVDLDRRSRRGVVVAVSVSALALVLPMAAAADGVVAYGHLLLLPLLVVALLAGTAAYSTATLLVALAVLVPAGAAGLVTRVDLPTAVGSQAVWWVVVVAGYLLAVDGDRRRSLTRQYQALFAGGATPTVTVSSHDGQVIAANAALGVLLATDPEGLAGRPVTELVASAPEAVAALRSLVLGEVDDVEVDVGLEVDGDDRWVRCTGVRIPLGGPQADVLQVQLLDMTAEQAQRVGLERSNRALERLGRRVAHDLTQPLAAIAGFARTLDQHHDAMDASVRRDVLDRLEAVAAGAVEQLRSTLDHALQRTAVPTAVDLHDVVTSVWDLVGGERDGADATVATSLEVATVRADAAVVRQVLANLLGNCRKYARPEVPLRVVVATRRAAGGVKVVVTDNGIGLPDDELETVFERGRRLAPGHAEGRGLGLWDSRDLVAAVGGSLHAESHSGGARFVMWLPKPATGTASGPARLPVVAGLTVGDELGVANDGGAAADGGLVDVA